MLFRGPWSGDDGGVENPVQGGAGGGDVGVSTWRRLQRPWGQLATERKINMENVSWSNGEAHNL